MKEKLIFKLIIVLLLVIMVSSIITAAFMSGKIIGFFNYWGNGFYLYSNINSGLGTMIKSQNVRR